MVTKSTPTPLKTNLRDHPQLGKTQVFASPMTGAAPFSARTSDKPLCFRLVQRHQIRTKSKDLP